MYGNYIEMCYFAIRSVQVLSQKVSFNDKEKKWLD